MNRTSVPEFADLPLNQGDPPFSAWGLYGKEDELGALNRLTSDVVLNAAREIKIGTRISLDNPLDLQKVPFFGRSVFTKNVITKAPRCVNDDTWSFNTQSSSQWDGLRHFAYQKERRFYNDRTLDDIVSDPNSTTLGIQNFSKHGIVGRGVLLDYHSWALEHGRHLDAFKTSPIPLEDLEAVAESQGVDFCFGDVLLIRSGYLEAFKAKSENELKELAAVHPPHLIGVEQGEHVLKWLWENFSAVAGDQPSFEAWPSQSERPMHEILLSGWGMPIGELWDMEELALHCKDVGRWSFFLSSKPCNVPGGVASPPNVLAIF